MDLTSLFVGLIAGVLLAAYWLDTSGERSRAVQNLERKLEQANKELQLVARDIEALAVAPADRKPISAPRSRFQPLVRDISVD